MISSEIDVFAIDARHWRNGWRLLVPPRVLSPQRWALVVVDGAIDRPVKAVIAGRDARGSVEVTPASSAAAYAKQLGVTGAVVVDTALVRQLSAEIEGALRFDSDGVAQGLVALRAVKKHAGHGLWTEPPLLEILPAPGYEPLQRTFDLLVPDESALVAYVIEDDRTRVHTSIIAVKQDGDITHAATHRAIADVVPEAELARDWQKQYRRVNDAVEAHIAKPSIALYVERATLMRILTGPSDQLARELDAKRLVIDPIPTWLYGLLGGAAVAAIAGRAASAVAKMLPQGARDRAASLAHRAQKMLEDSGAHPFALLGFDPLELWSRLKHYYRED
jgi:hypothetical protein